MQYSTLLLSALSISSAFAAAATHVVRVGSTNGTVKYFPSNVTAAVGDTIQFQFAGGNHTVTQSTFDQPCQPIAMNSNTTGFFSGFMPVAAGNATGMAPVVSMPVTVATPMWFYCSQAKHCEAGMVLVVNENTKANATRSLANFAALAAKATVNLAPSSNSTNSSSTSSSGSSSGTSSSSGSTSSSSGTTSNSGASSASSASSAPSSSSTALTTATGGASSFEAQNVLVYAGVLGAAVVAFL